MQRRSTLWGQLRVDMMLLAVLGAAGAAWYLHTHPLHLPARDEEAAGSPPPPSPLTADTLLVLPGYRDASAESFSQLDMSLGWYNTLAQELGTFRHTTATAFGPANLDGTRLLVLAASTCRAMGPEQIKAVGQWVESGGVLLIEQPDERWSAVLGLALGGGGLRPARRVTAADGLPARGSLRDALLETPLDTTMLPAQVAGGVADERSGVLMEVDGKPALIHRRRGLGHAYVLTLDMARAVMTLQQGKPLEDFSLPPVEQPSYVPPGMTQPHVLVHHEKLLAAEVPYADLLERNLLEVTASHLPLPRLWYYPGKLAGVYIMSHDEEAFGDKALYLTDWEYDNDHRSTSFIIPGPMTPKALKTMSAQGHDVQLHWNRGFGGAYVEREAGLGPWTPLRVELSLKEQRGALEGSLKGQPTAINRLHGLTLDQDWSSTFRKLAGAQIAADSSYGPTGPKQFGYLFGTGMPFYPMDHNGLLLPVQEIPFVLQDDENLQPALHRKLVTESEGGYHQVIMPIYHSNTMVNRPSVEAIQSWRSMFGFAARHNHWVTTLREYLLFEEARRGSLLRSRFLTGERRLEIEVELVQPRIAPPEGEGPDSKKLCPALAFPQQYADSGVESVKVDNAPVPFKELGRSGDGFFHTLELRCGRHSVQVIYAGGTPVVPAPAPARP